MVARIAHAGALKLGSTIEAICTASHATTR